MKNYIKILFIIIGLGILLTLFGCSSSIVIKEEPTVYKPIPKEPGPPPWAPAHGRRAKYRYHYYPESYVYFDIERRIYFYFYGDKWLASVSLPSGIYIDVNSYIVLEMDVAEPYHFHTEVVKRYPPGHLKKIEKGNEKRKEKGKGKD